NPEELLEDLRIIRQSVNTHDTAHSDGLLLDVIRLVKTCGFHLAAALVSGVGLKDIMYQSSRAAQSTQQPFTFYMAAAIIYLGLTMLITGFMM
ncbi:hypothetical protein R0K04_23400, partial [Pseudoalteromonas sp. SIMBA_153]